MGKKMIPPSQKIRGEFKKQGINISKALRNELPVLDELAARVGNYRLCVEYDSSGLKDISITSKHEDGSIGFKHLYPDVW